MPEQLRVGFSGTRKGLAGPQYQVLQDLLEKLHPAEVHHGDCLGADSEAHCLALIVGARRVIHPPCDDILRAYQAGEETRQPKRYLARNRSIVEETEVLIACPGEATEQLRSGTWSTIRYARRLGRLIYLVLPDGSLIQEPGRTEKTHA